MIRAGLISGDLSMQEVEGSSMMEKSILGGSSGVKG